MEARSVVCFSVRGYQQAPESLQGNLMGANLDQDAIRELSTRKQNLMLELNNYAENQRASQAVASGERREEASFL